MEYNQYLFKQLPSKQERQQQQTQVEPEEKIFYRRRIIDLCKRILTDQYDSTTLPPTDLIETFNGFCFDSIKYFKMKDKSDILQSEFHSVDVVDDNTFIPQGDALEMQDIIQNDLIGREVKTMRQVTFLDKHAVVVKPTFVKVNFPIERQVDLNDPKLQTKGILDDIDDDSNQDINI